MPSRIERHNILLSCPGDVDRLMPTVFEALHDFNEHYRDTRNQIFAAGHLGRYETTATQMSSRGSSTVSRTTLRRTVR